MTNPDSPKDHLHRLSAIILADECHHGTLFTATQEWHRLCWQLAGVNPDSEALHQDIYLESGLAVCTLTAAQCLIDLYRTRAFARGLRQAILDQQKTGITGPVKILYVGPGPFATLALPITTVFSPEEVQFDLLEVNPLSLDCLDKVASALGIEAYFGKRICGDAALHRIDPEDMPDILVFETMQRSLKRETHTRLMMHFCSQIPASTLLLPESIQVELALRKKKTTDQPAEYSSYALLMDLNRDFAIELEARRKLGREIIPPMEFHLQQEDFDRAEATHFALLTTIRVYKDEALDFNWSSLTMPLDIQPITGNQPRLFHIHYRMEGVPGWEFYYKPLN